MKPTDTQIESVRDHLLGTCSTLHGALQSLEIDESLFGDIEEQLGDWIEECKGCGWWHEIGELAGFHDGPDGFCDQCRDDIED